MTKQISLKDLEKSMFRESIQDGIIDIQIGAFLLIFAIAPLLSRSLGDFWSSMVFLPFWGLLFLGLRIVRKKMIKPRIGKIEFGSYRKKRLSRLNLGILVFNLIALVLGVLSFYQFSDLPGWVHTARFSIVLLVGFSLAGYMLEFTRLYIYGFMAAAAPMIGEYFYQNFGFSHHGFPVTFGVLSSIFIITGIVILIQIFQKYPLPDEELPE